MNDNIPPAERKPIGLPLPADIPSDGSVPTSAGQSAPGAAKPEPPPTSSKRAAKGRSQRGRHPGHLPQSLVAAKAFGEQEALYTLTDSEQESVALVDAQLAGTSSLDRLLRKLAERKRFSIDDSRFFPVRGGGRNGLRSLYEAVYPALQGYSDIFLYSPHVAAFYELATEEGYLVGGRLSPTADIFVTFRFGGKDAAEKFFAKLAGKYCSPEFKQAYRNRWARIKRCDRSINKLFHRALVLNFPNGVIAVGVDLYISPLKVLSEAGQLRHVPVAIEDAMVDLLRERKRFVKNLDEYPELRGHLGWVHVPSVNVHSGPIIHCVFFYPADSKFNARKLATKIGKRWSSLIGVPDMYHSWLSDQNPFKRAVCGLVSTSELSSIRNFYHLAYYLAMKGFWLGPRMPGRSDLFFRSELFSAEGTRKSRQRGRTRRQDVGGPDLLAGSATNVRGEAEARISAMRSLAKVTKPRKVSPTVAAVTGEQGDLLYPQAAHQYRQLLAQQVVADEQERERLRFLAEAKARAAAVVPPMYTRMPDYSTWVPGRQVVTADGILVDSGSGQSMPTDPVGADGGESESNGSVGDDVGPIRRAIAAGLKYATGSAVTIDPLDRAGLKMVPKPSKRSDMTTLRKPGYTSGVVPRPAQGNKRSSEINQSDDGDRGVEDKDQSS